jgi:hypothetical protein
MLTWTFGRLVSIWPHHRPRYNRDRRWYSLHKAADQSISISCLCTVDKRFLLWSARVEMCISRPALQMVVWSLKRGWCRRRDVYVAIAVGEKA